jgi:hypothetical protein
MLQPTPVPEGASSYGLGGVSCASATACVAIGSATASTNQLPIAEVCDGAAWSAAPPAYPPGSAGVHERFTRGAVVTRRQPFRIDEFGEGLRSQYPRRESRPRKPIRRL